MYEFVFSKKPMPFNDQSPALVLVKNGNTFLSKKDSGELFFKPTDLLLPPQEKSKLLHIGDLNGTPLFALEQNLSVPNTEYKHAYGLLDTMEPSILKAVYRASQLLNWDKSSQFCGCCGGQMRHVEHEFAKSCENKHKSYPQYSPSMLVIVRRGNQILLARSPHFPKDLYSALAGFLEAGETAEEAVKREVMEEVGLRVKNIKPFCTEPWPFPNSMMVAYTAEWESGEIKCDPSEIEDAGWYYPSDLPMLPMKATTSYALIQEGRRLCYEAEATKVVQGALVTSGVLSIAANTHPEWQLSTLLPKFFTYRNNGVSLLSIPMLAGIQFYSYQGWKTYSHNHPEFPVYLTHPVSMYATIGTTLAASHYGLSKAGVFFRGNKTISTAFIPTLYSHSSVAACVFGVYPYVKNYIHSAKSSEVNTKSIAGLTSAMCYGLLNFPVIAKDKLSNPQMATSGKHFLGSVFRNAARHLFLRAPLVGVTAVAMDTLAETYSPT